MREMKILFMKKRWIGGLFAFVAVSTLIYIMYILSWIGRDELSASNLLQKQRNIELLNKRINDLERKAARYNHILDQLNKVVNKLSSQQKSDGNSISDVSLNISNAIAVASGGDERVKAASKQLTAFLKQSDWLADQPLAVDVKMSEVMDKLPYDDVDGGVWKQGFPISYEASQWSRANKLDIIVVPHSHNDPGWLLTFQQYFDQQTRPILDTVVNALTARASRKFIWAETSYLALWWEQASVDMRDKLRRLIVDTRQLEIVTGGWVMTDEANANYYAMIEQMIEGHEWLKANVAPSVRPVAGWAIDPFGYTPTMAYLLGQMGFSNMVIQRVHYHIKKHFAQTLQYEFQWAQQWSTQNSKDTSIFCHVMPFYSYDIPHTCGPDPKICCQFDFKRTRNGQVNCPWGIPAEPITARNVKERAELLLDQYRKRAQLYGGADSHTTIMVPLGDDFRYTSMDEALAQYENYERLMEYMNSDASGMNVNIRFGTLTDYFDLLHAGNKTADEQKRRTNWPTLQGDFFTYADRQDHYWSGYYTSRPFMKRLDRLTEAYLRSAEILYSLAHIARSLDTSNNNNAADKFKRLYKRMLIARRHLGLFQHHDGITGTAKTAVVLDYAEKLQESLDISKQVIEESATMLLNADQKEQKEPLVFKLDEVGVSSKEVDTLLHLDDSAEGASERHIVLYNSNAHKRVELVSFVVNAANVEVLDERSQAVRSQLSLIWPNSEVSRALSNSQSMAIERSRAAEAALDFDSTGRYELLFHVELAPLSLTSFTVRRSATASPTSHATTTLYVDEMSESVESDVKSRLARQLPNAKHQVTVAKFTDTADSGGGDIVARVSDEHTAHLSPKTGCLLSIESTTKSNNNKKKKKLTAAISLLKYGTTSAPDKSGAYLFLPDGKARELGADLKRWLRVEQGALRTRACLNMSLVLHCVDVLPTVSAAMQLEHPLVAVWNVVDLTRGAAHNIEIVMHVRTGIDNAADRSFHTDLNGFQFTRRRTHDKLPIQGNVYPMPTAAFIQDERRRQRMYVLSAQPLGVAALETSCLQVFLDRRLEQDDNRGLNQAINDNVPTSSKFILFFESGDGDEQKQQAEASWTAASAEHPSLVAQWLSSSLLNPVHKLVPTKASSAQGDKSATSRQFLDAAKYPCDLRLLNMRTMQTSDEEPLSNQVGLLLHRLVDGGHRPLGLYPNKFVQEACQLDTAGHEASKAMSFQDLFADISRQRQRPVRVESTWLTLAAKSAAEQDEATVLKEDLVLKHVQPMQIEAFRLHY